MECRQKENSNKCPCTSVGCSRRGMCCMCISHHLAKKQLPACCFSSEAEKTHDRSFEAFIKDQGRK